jgi:hypothetical protein
MAAASSRIPRCCDKFLTGASGRWPRVDEDEILLDPFVDLSRLGLMLRKRDIIALANRARDAGQWGLATQLYRKALDRDSRNSPIWVQYGHALKESGERRDPDKLAQAEVAYRRALSLDAGVADTYLQLGHVLKLQGKTEEARAAYLRALALDPLAPYPVEELSGLGWSEAQMAELRGMLPNGSSPENCRQVTHREDPSRPMPTQPPPSAEQPPVLAIPDREFDSDSTCAGERPSLRARIEAAGLFDPDAYLSLNEDLRAGCSDAWAHFLAHGFAEGRPFTTPEGVVRLLAQMHAELDEARDSYLAAATRAFGGADNSEIAAMFRKRGVRIGVFCSTEGNFYMQEIADLLAWGLQALEIDAVQRNETGDKDERFDFRVFVAPHEFFTLGQGTSWTEFADAPGTVLYNVEQVQTPWFCRAFPLLLRAPLVLDLNFQSAEILRRAGCNVVHFMPGHLPTSPYGRPYVDVSGIELVKGYPFARQRYDWLERNELGDRPIDLLFVGSSAPRRDNALARLRDLADEYRFLCVYTRQDAPLTSRNYRSTSSEINCALAQRAKIVLNIHRDWLGYFEWSRTVMQGFWQGACVLSDPGLRNPIFEPGVHYLEESVRHIGELARWLLATTEGRETLETTRTAGYRRATVLGSMRVALAPVLNSLKRLLPI